MHRNHFQVTQEQNIGSWLNQHYGDRSKFARVLDRVVFARSSPAGFEDHSGSCISLVPNSTVNEFFVKLNQLDYSSDAKHGCSSEYYLIFAFF